MGGFLIKAGTIPSTLVDFQLAIQYQGPLFCILSRMFSILCGIISKKILLMKGFRERLKEKRRIKVATCIQPKDLDDNGQLKQRFVRKSSVIYKRASFYKALNDKIIVEVNKNEESEMTTEKSKSRRSSEDQNPDRRRALENLRRLKRSSIDRLLKSKQAFLMKVENTEIPTMMNETRTDLLGRNKQNQSTQSVDYKKIENDFFENLELEAMIDHYDHVQLHMHLFNGKDDIVLSKLDSIFDQAIYDDQMVGTCDYTTYELHSVSGALGAFPLTLLGSFLAGEMPEAYHDLLNGKIVGPMGESYGPVAVVSVFSILFALRPYFLHKIKKLKVQQNFSNLHQILVQILMNQTKQKHKIMLDAAIMRDYRCLYLTANPIVMSRRLFDPEYDYRIADWVISEDPHLSNKALQQASELKQEILIKREQTKERKRREKIDKIYQQKIDEQKRIQVELAKKYLVPLPTAQPFDPRIHFNTSIDMLQDKNLMRRKTLNMRKDILFKESDLPDNFREQIQERKTMVPQSFLHSMYKLIDEKSIQIQHNEDLEKTMFKNIFEQADWLNMKKAGVLMGIEDYVKLDIENNQVKVKQKTKSRRKKEFQLKRMDHSESSNSDEEDQKQVKNPNKMDLFQPVTEFNQFNYM
ncbi:UNKNOWN [Stylonychia lemnae]|uniref:Uncharacterized protein n=1 Tax=Stylonychia lemnae TaxID=5949 RepID=A0A078AY43_STYLE|nr:UNKNOWN [Stylonychia lemnae]|eukprot:CDW87345.1 UNKNOWN [Stylonychia lemnae]